MVGVDAQFGRPQVAATAFGGPSTTSIFEVEGDPMAFGIQGGTAGVYDGVNGAARLFLF